MVFRSHYFNQYRPLSSRRSRRTLRRSDGTQDYLETIIIHSDSSDEERRLGDEIDSLRERMDDLDEEKRRLRSQMARKFRERENIRVARQIKKNNLRLRREFEQRLLPTIETIAARRQDIIHGVRNLFEDIDDHEETLPPSYQELFPNGRATTALAHSTPNSTATTSNGTRDAGTTTNGNESDSSDISLPSVNSIFESLRN